MDEKDLGEIIGKYSAQIGPRKAITLYNVYALKVIERGENYTKPGYVRTADRFMSYCIHKYEI